MPPLQLQTLRLLSRNVPRYLTTSTRLNATKPNGKHDGPPMHPEQPASIAKKARHPEVTPDKDPQSNASLKEENRGDHPDPAKTADPQGGPSRSTGFGSDSETAGGEARKDGRSGSG